MVDASADDTRAADGHVPLRSYAVIGDGRTVALVAADARIDWLALPDLDSSGVFSAVLDAQKGGAFELTPTVPFEVTRRYLPRTNVLETTFHTERGEVRLLDAMTFAAKALGPLRELQRRVEAVSGEVPMAWRVQPRFGFGLWRTRLERRAGHPIASAGSDAVAVIALDAGEPSIDDGAISAEFCARPGTTSVIALAVAHQEPLVFATRAELDERFERTVTEWQAWSELRRYDGPWHHEVARSALALKLLIHAPSGAVAAAATTSLPEDIGGERNWDYRLSWVRDSVFTLAALFRLGSAPEARAYFWWLVQASQLTRPALQPLYRLDGGARTVERALPLPGYRKSRPVRIGNAAAGQLQLDTYGELLQTAWLYVQAGERLDRDVARQLRETADLICQLWVKPDAGIWEVRSEPAHFTHSKMMCWIGLDCARQLAEAGWLPASDIPRWQSEADAIAEFVETHCFSHERGSYLRAAGHDELDASVLLALLAGYGDRRSARWSGTVDELLRVLGRGPYLLRYLGEDGLAGAEGSFVSCSFWMAEALARTGRLAEATTLMHELVGLANDVGLYSEEIDSSTGTFLGNLPQGLSHLSLISAATAIAEESR